MAVFPWTIGVVCVLQTNSDFRMLNVSIKFKIIEPVLYGHGMDMKRKKNMFG